MGQFNYLRFARLLLGVCVLHTIALIGVAAVIFSEPTHNALLVPRADAIFIVGENDFGLVRIKSFQSVQAAQTYLTARGWRIPTLTPAHIRPEGRIGQLLSSNRMTWTTPLGRHAKFTPIVEAPNAETARFLNQWIESGNLQESHLGFAIRLEAI